MALNTEQKTLVEERVLEGERAAFASRAFNLKSACLPMASRP